MPTYQLSCYYSSQHFSPRASICDSRRLSHGCFHLLAPVIKSPQVPGGLRLFPGGKVDCSLKTLTQVYWSANSSKRQKRRHVQYTMLPQCCSRTVSCLSYALRLPGRAELQLFVKTVSQNDGSNLRIRGKLKLFDSIRPWPVAHDFSLLHSQPTPCAETV